MQNTISLGNIITLAVILVSAVGGWFTMQAEVQASEDRITRLEGEMQQIEMRIRQNEINVAEIKSDLRAIRDDTAQIRDWLRP
ncbi:MAG: hypothetical protein AAFQ36_09425 [Pseudomonadota bacterium]